MTRKPPKPRLGRPPLSSPNRSIFVRVHGVTREKLERAEKAWKVGAASVVRRLIDRLK